jgi:DUF1680 family protein
MENEMADASDLRPRALFRPPEVSRVDVRGFWGARVDAVASRTAEILYLRCVEAGMLDQIDPDRPPPGVRIPFHVHEGVGVSSVTTQMFWDSDLGKTIETAAYSLHRKPIPSSRPRSTRSSRCTPNYNSPTATCRAGISACSRASGGPTCAIATNSIAPGI